jgi:maltose-binding protein MalE
MKGWGKVLCIIASGTISVFLAACDPAGLGKSSPENSPAAKPPQTKEITTATSVDIRIPPAEIRSGITLTLWTTENFFPLDDRLAGEIMRSEIKQFEEEHQQITLQPMLKASSGDGSIYQYIRTASPVAPSILPDIAVIHNTDLIHLARLGYIPAIEDIIPAAMIHDFQPVSLSSASIGDHIYGMPFAVDVEHLLYNTQKVTFPPQTWADVLTLRTQYAFPAEGRNGLVNDAFLIHYLSNGTELAGSDGKLVIAKEPLLRTLQFYEQGLDAGIIPSMIQTTNSTAALLPFYLESGPISLMNIKSSEYLEKRSILQSSGVAAVPSQNGKELTIANSWSYVILAQDADKRLAAMSFLEFMLTPQRQEEWCTSAHFLPSSQTAIENLAANDSYWRFASNMLKKAVPAPSMPGYEQLGSVLLQAEAEVLKGDVTAQQAVEEAVAKFKP